MKKLFSYFVVFLLLANCKKLPKLTLATGDEGGNYHQGGLVLKNFAAKSGLEIDVTITDGSYENVMQVGQGKSDLGLAQRDVLVYFNFLSEDHKKASQNSLVIAPIELEFVHILVNNNSNIRTMEDLKKKKVGTGSGKSGTSFSFGFISSYLYQLNVDNKGFLTMDEGEAIKKVAAGELDAAFLVSTLGSKVLKELPAESNVRLLSVSKGEISERIKEIYLLEKVPANTYPWQKEEIVLPAIHSFLIVSNMAPEESVKKLVKIIYENEDKLDHHSEIWSEDATEVYNKMADTGVPYHPIVKDFFKRKK